MDASVHAIVVSQYIQGRIAEADAARTAGDPRRSERRRRATALRATRRKAVARIYTPRSITRP